MISTFMVIGLAGFMCSGKSYAGNFLQTMGVEFIESDEVVNELYVQGEDGYRKIVNFYGQEYLCSDGEINRIKLAKNAFQSKTHVEVLNNLIHPLVMDKVRQKLRKYRNKIVFIEGIRFDKKGLGSLVDQIWWIDVNENILLKRLGNNKVFGGNLDKKVIDLQFQPEKIDLFIKNNGTKKEFESKLIKLYEQLSLLAE